MIAVTARRYPLVDEETGVVLGLVLFIRPPGAMQRRNLLSEWFPIENNKITGIWASMFYPEPQAPVPNWPPFEGNFPLSGSPPPTGATSPVTGSAASPSYAADVAAIRGTMGRFAQPDEIAKAVLFLAADGSYITGQQINVNGGVYM